MEISDDVQCLFTAEIDEPDGSYVIEIPQREVALGTIDPAVPYGIAVVSSDTRRSSSSEGQSSEGQTEPEPPVAEGDHRTVDIEDIGEQGDGVARVERGYVVIVPDTRMNERVKIEITDVKPTVAFGEVLEREEYYQ